MSIFIVSAKIKEVALENRFTEAEKLSYLFGQ